MMTVGSIPIVEDFLAVWTFELAFIINQMLSSLFRLCLVCGLVVVNEVIVFQHFFSALAASMQLAFNYHVIWRGNAALNFVVFIVMISCSIPTHTNLLTMLAPELAFIFNQMLSSFPLSVMSSYLMFVQYPVIFQKILSTQRACMKLTLYDQIIWWGDGRSSEVVWRGNDR